MDKTMIYMYIFYTDTELFITTQRKTLVALYVKHKREKSLEENDIRNELHNNA